MVEEVQDIFFATSFRKKCREHTQQLADAITEVGFSCVLGEDFGGDPIPEGVKMSIGSSSLVIGLFERPSSSSREPSQWVMQELAYATALKKPCLLLVEAGVRFSRGLLGDVEFISFDAPSFASVFPRVLRQLNVMLRKQGRAIGIKESPSPRLYISEEPNEKDCNERARAQLKTASNLTESMQYDLALEHAKKATTLDRNCWQAWIKYGGLLFKSGRVAEGTKIHTQMLKDFKANNTARAAAKHNLAVAKELCFGLGSERANREARPLYECALALDPSRVYTRAALICVYLRLHEVEDAHKLLEASLRYEGFSLAMRRELDESVDGLKLVTLLPTWAQNLLYPLRRRVGFEAELN